MSDLKTLKDLQICCVSETYPEDSPCEFSEKILRKEAKKWFEHYNKDGDKSDVTLLLRYWIKDFFNLGDE